MYTVPFNGTPKSHFSCPTKRTIYPTLPGGLKIGSPRTAKTAGARLLSSCAGSTPSPLPRREPVGRTRRTSWPHTPAIRVRDRSTRVHSPSSRERGWGKLARQPSTFPPDVHSPRGGKAKASRFPRLEGME